MDFHSWIRIVMVWSAFCISPVFHFHCFIMSNIPQKFVLCARNNTIFSSLNFGCGNLTAVQSTRCFSQNHRILAIFNVGFFITLKYFNALTSILSMARPDRLWASLSLWTSLLTIRCIVCSGAFCAVCLMHRDRLTSDIAPNACFPHLPTSQP